jgi:hypothetical protein
LKTTITQRINKVNKKLYFITNMLLYITYENQQRLENKRENYRNSD